MNDTLLPNKMTKSYLLESDPYLKTSSKSSPFALNSDETVFRGSSAWNGTLHYSGDLINDRPTVKPLAMHNVPSNVPPIAYINGNSVRPVRCRHYSQQQTVFHNNNSNSSEKLNSAIKVAAGDMHHYAQSNENGVSDELMFGGNAADCASFDRQIGKGSPDPKNGCHSAVASSKPLANGKAKVQSSDSGQSAATTRQQQQKSPVKQRSKSPSALRDYVTNNENESSIYNLYENTEQVVEHLAKRIEDVLRTAKENRRLMCTELLIPQNLTAMIANAVIKESEDEPCGLRGCRLYICIEDTTSGQGGVAANKHHKSSDHSHQGNSNHSIASRLLGEVAIDRNTVTTFEVFLTLKRAPPSWLESIENKLLSNLLGKERVVISELYLLHKKQLYAETPSPPTL